MQQAATFQGFPRQLDAFFTGLAANNNKAWFEAHRDEYEALVLFPAQDFVYELGKRMKKVVPGLIADPRTNGSIFRIYRDTRFSKDKTPYKTHLAILLWEGEGKKLERPSFYFQIEPGRVYLGAGLYRFNGEQIQRYRDAVVDPRHGAALTRAMTKVADAGPYGFGGEHYKRVPRGYDPEHKMAGLLRHNGLFVGYESKTPAAIHTAKAADWCAGHFAKFAPLHKWLQTRVAAP